MNELSLYILDIVQNSIKANSKNIIININEDLFKNILTVEVIDDGKGMDEKSLSKVCDPFFTSRTTRRVGLGVPLFKELCETCSGNFIIKSTVDKHDGNIHGTNLKGSFQYDHIDRPPLGDMVETIYLIIINDENIDIVYNHQYINKDKSQKSFSVNTKEIKEILDGVSLKQIEVMVWLKEYLKEGLNSLK